MIPEDSDESEADIEEEKFEDNVINFQNNLQTNITSDSPSKRKKVVTKNASMTDNGKVTKTNFFTNDSNQITQADDELADLNESMISCKVDPKEWNQEVDKVTKELLLFYKDMEKIDLSPLEKFLAIINEAPWKEVSSMVKEKQIDKNLNKIIDCMSSELYSITREETRMNK